MGVLGASCASARALSAVAFVLLLSFALVRSTEGRSDGFLGVCDLTPRYHDYAVPPLLLPNGYFGGNASFGLWTYNMNWVQMATPSAAYTLRSADGASSDDPTTYVPGQPMDIHLRVADVRKQFIGLLMYATNSTDLVLSGTKVGLPKNTKLEQHVGTWRVRQSDPYQVCTSCPVQYAPAGSTVTHSDADVKPVHARFTWTGVSGSGTVRFRVLIKWDGQGRGAFYFPVKELVLQEAQKAPQVALTQQTVIGKAGTACADTCYQQTPTTPYCNAKAMIAIQSNDALDKVLGVGLGLRTPYLAACPYAGAPQIRTDGYAQFRSLDVAATCPQSIQAAPPARMADVCYTQVKASSKPICICSADSMVQTRNPFDPALNSKVAVVSSRVQRVTAETKTSAAASSKSGVRVELIAALALVAAASTLRSSRALLLLSVCLCMMLLSAPVQGHNWIQSQHRAAVASVNKPCQARIGRQPHVQVIPKQDFEVEWTGGHGDMANPSPFMFAVVHEANYSQLAVKNITAIMQDYVSLAPASAHFDRDLRYQRHHIHYSKVPTGRPECYVDPKGSGVNPCGDYFMEDSINATSYSHYIVRDAMYQQTARKYKDGNGYVVTQQRFKQEYLTKDMRVSYYSAKYPWLESVSIFPHLYIGDATLSGQFTSQSDIARFKIDARSGPGSYIVYFAWSSYSDCVDVDVQKGPTAVANRYGSDAAAAGQLGEVVRLDHCELRYVQQAASPCRRMNSSLDATACINACVNKNRCQIQIVRAKNMPGTMPLPVNIPYAVQRDSPATCKGASVTQRADAGCPVDTTLAASKMCTAAQIGPLNDDDYVCYEAKVWKDQDTGVEEDFKLAKDPMDPAWYSSCIFAKPAAGFINLPKAQYVEPPWQIAEKCVDCTFQRGLSAIDSTRQPDWGMSLNPVCPDCDVRNTASIELAAMVGADLSKAGAPYVGPEPESDSSSTGGVATAPSSSSTGGAAAGANGNENGGNENGTDGPSSRSSGKGVLDNKLYLALIIAGGSFIVLLLVASVVVVLRRRAASAASLKRMTNLNFASSGESELIQNPASHTHW